MAFVLLRPDIRYKPGLVRRIGSVRTNVNRKLNFILDSFHPMEGALWLIF